MTNTSKIKFGAKYSLKYMNGIYVLSGFNHVKSLKITEEVITDVLESGLENFSEQEWYDFVEENMPSNYEK